ncbi:hypothetical protein [Microbacterium marmarense]|uniref:PKD domain-containing protein n=1 Tax=Microbacterium marmarense TaxID=3122051 RepID=A0ABU8LST4_9MICO
MALSVGLLATDFAEAIANNSPCDDATMWTCDLTSDNTQLDISASETVPGGGGSDGSDSSGGGGHNQSPGSPAPGDDEDIFIGCSTQYVLCNGQFTIVSLSDITLEDLASFRPPAPSLSGEPLGFGLLGAPTNRVAQAQSSEFAATILDMDVVVRFTPATYVFDNGDGSTTTSATGGASWESLGAPQFSPTDTSHTYLTTGNYPISLTVQFAPEVRLDTGTNWYRVPGTITAGAPTYSVQIVEARTALVDRTCDQDPDGPGC